jgi:hypothetical protein
VLDLPKAPAPDAYAVTGDLLPPFLRAALAAWEREFPQTTLTANGVILVIRPDQFYSGLDPYQRQWLASREMLGIANFPLVINPLTPGDDWYLAAQSEWKRGNDDAIYVLLTSLYHEVAHTRRGSDERSAYREQLELFERFQQRGKLASPYGQLCHRLLSDRCTDLVQHPERYVQVTVRLGGQTTAILVRPDKAPAGFLRVP